MRNTIRFQTISWTLCSKSRKIDLLHIILSTWASIGVASGFKYIFCCQHKVYFIVAYIEIYMFTSLSLVRITFVYCLHIILIRLTIWYVCQEIRCRNRENTCPLLSRPNKFRIQWSAITANRVSSAMWIEFMITVKCTK